MADLLQTGLAWLAAQMKANAATVVTYRRGAQSVAVAATLGTSLLRVTDNQGQTRTVRTDRDFLIAVADLVLGGVATTPADGDKIDLTIGAVTERFEVMPVGSEPAWRYSDPHKLRFRVHTKYRAAV